MNEKEFGDEKSNAKAEEVFKLDFGAKKSGWKFAKAFILHAKKWSI